MQDGTIKWKVEWAMVQVVKFQLIMILSSQKRIEVVSAEPAVYDLGKKLF
jgi:hypothetical protein